MRMLSGLMSRCSTPCECRYSSASTSDAPKNSVYRHHDSSQAQPMVAPG